MAQSGPSLASELASRQQNMQPSPTSLWARQAKQFGLLLAGAGFMAASVAVTRRSITRRKLDSLPKFYASNRHVPKVDSNDRQLLAVSAFGLATLNVMSFGVMLIGGISWGFDLSTIGELRERTQASLRKPMAVPTNPAEEKEFQDMMEGMLGKLGLQLPKDDKLEETSEKKD